MIAALRETSHPEAGRPVDLVHLSRVTFGDRALEREVLGLFLRQSVIQLDRLKCARTVEGFGSAAHLLKGSAQGIGAARVAVLASEAESMAERHATVEAFRRGGAAGDKARRNPPLHFRAAGDRALNPAPAPAG